MGSIPIISIRLAFRFSKGSLMAGHLNWQINYLQFLRLAEIHFISSRSAADFAYIFGVPYEFSIVISVLHLVAEIGKIA